MITVIDAITGSGKSSWAIQNIIKDIKENKKIIYVTPYLTEIDRLKSECKKHNIVLEEPDYKRGNGSKSLDLRNLMSKGENIVTTHACFDKLSKEFLYTVKDIEYTLYMDEVHEVLKQYELSDDDLNMLITNKYITFDEDTKRVIWNSNMYDGLFEDFKNLCEIGSIYFYSNKVYIWTFPHSIFNAIKNCYILTYLFKGQNQCHYYDMYDIPYQIKSIKNTTPNLVGMEATYKIVDYDIEQYLKDIAAIKPLINIYEGKLNLDYNLSSYYLNNADEDNLEILKNNIYNYFRNILKSKSDDNMWTTLLDYKHILKGKGYTKGFIEITARATNAYSHKKNLAYVYDRFMNPIIYNFFVSKGVEPNQDLYAVSEIVQWVFRSAVRKNENINLYMPSKRMRNLFIKWISGELIQQV